MASSAQAAEYRLVVLPLDITRTGGKMTDDARTSREEMLRGEAANALRGTGWSMMTGANTIRILQRLSREWGDKVTVLLIHVGGTEEQRRAVLAELKIELPSVIDESAIKSREQYCADTLPRLFVLDSRAFVRALIGSDDFESKLRAEVDKVSKLLLVH